MDALEKQAAGLTRREAALRDALRSILVALREQRAYSDSLYDELYSLRERVEELEPNPFRIDEEQPAATPLASIAERSESMAEMSASSPPDSVRDPVSVVPAGEVGASGGPAAEPPAPTPAPDAVVALGARPDNVDDEPIGCFTVEEVEAILEAREEETNARFQSIQRNDQALKKGLKSLLSAKRSQQPA